MKKLYLIGLCMFILISMAYGVNASIVAEYKNTPTWTTAFVGLEGDNTKHELCQSFVALNNDNVTGFGINFGIKENLEDDEVFNVTIKTVSCGGVKLGKLNKTIVTSEIIGSSWQNFTFDSQSNLTLGNTYYLVMEIVSNWAALDQLNWLGVVNNDYANGTEYASYDDGAWGDDVSFADFNFQIIGFGNTALKIINITINKPLNNTGFSSNTITTNHSKIWINITHDFNGVVNCTINQTEWTLFSNSGSTCKFKNNTLLLEKIYFPKITLMNFSNFAHNGTNTTKFRIDITSPVITPAVKLANNDTIVYNGTLSTAINFSDNIEIYSINVTFANHTILFNKTNVGKANYRLNISYGIDPTVSNSIIARVCDAHTTTAVSDITRIDKINGGLKYVIEDNFLKLDKYVYIYPQDTTSFVTPSTEKLGDRYSFDFNKKTLPATTEVFIVEATSKIDIIANSKYVGHLVIPELNRWVDFENKDNAKVTLRRISNTKVEVSVIGLKNSNIVFNSIGELNCVNKTYYFNNLNPNYGFSANVFGGVQQTITLNISQDKNMISSISAFLRYNGTKYAADNNANYSTTFTTLSTSIDRTINLSWTLNISGTTYFLGNQTQDIITINIDDCSVYGELLLNYSLRDEETSTYINTENKSIKVDLDIYKSGYSGVFAEYSHSFSANNATICVDENLTQSGLSLYVITEYSADNYVHEFYYIQNYTLSNATMPIAINLYDLKTVDSQSFVITYKDNVFLPVDGAVIETLRFYTENGTYKVIENSLTDEQGQTIAHLVTEDVQYSFYIKKNGKLLSTFDNLIAACLVDPCQINLYEFQSITGALQWGTYPNLNYNFDFNKTTRVITILFSTQDSTPAKLNLSVDILNEWSNESVCNNVLTDSSGTLTCTIPIIYGNTSIKTKLYMNDKFVTLATYTLQPDGFELFGYTGYFMAAIMYLSLVFMMITSLVGTIIFAIAGIVLSGALALTSSSMLFSIASITIWFVVAGIIILVKVSNRD